MLRVTIFSVLVSGVLGLTAYRFADPKYVGRPLPVNSTVASASLPYKGRPDFPISRSGFEAKDRAAVCSAHILMMNYTAYDTVYVSKVRYLISRNFPGAVIADFWTGSADDLNDALAEQDIVVVTYPATGAKKQVQAYGKVLTQFVRKGGAVVFSGTNQYDILQQFGLIDLDFGYFCSDLEVHETTVDHPVLVGTPGQFSITNYAYPLDISDPGFVTLADIHDCPTMGYKNLGKGKVVYLGLEYYFDETISTRILANTLQWLMPPAKPPVSTTSVSDVEEPRWTTRSVKRTEEVLYAGSGTAVSKALAIDLKIYPNPYFEKATLDIDLLKSAVVTIELTDESGALIATPYLRRTVSAGLLRIELPDVSPGVYFVKCQIDGQNMVKKVVKVSGQ